MDYSEPCKYSIRLIEKLKSLDTKNILDFGLINKKGEYYPLSLGNLSEQELESIRSETS